jgi:outer membrane protein TolC
MLFAAPSCALLVLLAGARAAAGAPIAPGDTLNLAALLREALANHPDVARARSMAQAEEQRVPAAGALENPVLELALDEQPFEGSGTGERQIGLSQEVPFPGKRGMRTDAARGQAGTARELALDAERTVVAAVKVAYWELFLQENRTEILRESRTALADVVAAARVRYETGLGGQQDLLLAMVEASKLDGEILHAEAVTAAARSRVNLLLGREAEAPLGRAVADSLTPFDASLEDLLEAAREARPSVRAAQHGVAAAAAEARLARAAARPDFLLGGMYMQTREGPDEWRASLGLTLPVWKGRREDAESREAAHRHDAARSALDAERLRAAATVEEQYAHVASEREIVQLYRREILPQSDLAYHSARTGYLAGRETFLVLLEAVRNSLELESSYYEYFADSEMHLAWLEEAVGRDLAPREVDP